MSAGGQWCEDHGYVSRDMALAHDQAHEGPIPTPNPTPAGCCQACQGSGGTSNGPCWNCQATGCAHPPPLCPQPGENPVEESEANRHRWVAEGDWVSVDVGHHTCGTERGGHYGAHERGCGLEPLTQAVNAEHARHLVDDHNALLDRVTALEGAARAMLAAWGNGPDVDVRTNHRTVDLMLTGYPSTVEEWLVPADTMRPLLEALDDALKPEPSPGDTNPPRATPDPPTGNQEPHEPPF